ATHRRIFAFRALRTRVVEIKRERNHLALLHETRRGDNILRRRIVERADLVVRTPLAPVFVLFGGVTHILTIDLSGRHRMSSDEVELQREYSLWARAMQAPLATSSCNATMNKKGGKTMARLLRLWAACTLLLGALFVGFGAQAQDTGGYPAR